MSIEAMKRIKSLLQDTKMIDSHTISAVVAECDMAILAQQPATQPADVTDEREAFEAEMRCEDVWGHRSLKKRADGRYENWLVDLMWDVWQARSKLTIPALRPVQGVPIGEVGTMPGTSGFTMACFRADEVPVGTKIYTTPQPTQATQVEVTDAEIDALCLSLTGFMTRKERDRAVARAILALRPVQVPMTDEVFDLICNAIDKADTITMEGDYMLDSDDCIAVVRVMQALLSVRHGITAQAKKETP